MNEAYCVSTPPSYTHACGSPGGPRALLKERTGMEGPPSPLASSLASLALRRAVSKQPWTLTSNQAEIPKKFFTENVCSVSNTPA